jgi:hypothetical protein
MTAREEEIIARDLLAHPEKVGVCLRDRRWAELAALVRMARRDVPPDLAQTDPALYRTLRDQITRFWLSGGSRFDLKKLEKLAVGSSQ